MFFSFIVLFGFQVWEKNMLKASDPKIKEYSGEDYTKVTFKPDLTKFKMESLDDDIVALFSRRAYDVAGTGRGVKVLLNGKRLPVSSVYFLSYSIQSTGQAKSATGTRLIFKLGTLPVMCCLFR
jgi:DNA gyrase/topoisomerase IV subunit B